MPPHDQKNQRILEFMSMIDVRGFRAIPEVGTMTMNRARRGHDA
jgi:hypothetical protein